MTDDDTPTFATNFQMNGPMITSRTHHKVRSADGLDVVAECGQEFSTEEHGMMNDATALAPGDKCGHCWDNPGDGE